MENTFKISSSPHVRDKSSTTAIMRDVIIALAPATIFGIINFELDAMILILTCVASCVLFEWLYEMLLGKTVTVKDLSAVVTGLLLALNLSPEVPVWMAILGSAFAIVIVKQLFGGLGYNFMNPALGARCFLLISFAGRMTTFSYDGVTCATPLAILKNTGDVSNVNLFDMFIGNTAGTIGETSTLCLLIGAAYLLIRKVIKPVIPLTYIGTFAVLIVIYSLGAGRGFDLPFLAAHLTGGGLMLGAFFMATDYVTSPITPRGKIVFGVILGVLTFVFRIFGGSAEGVSYAIIFSNLLVPLIERWTQPKSFGYGAELADQGAGNEEKSSVNVKSIVIATVAIFAITLVAGGALAYVQDVTKEPIEKAEQEAKEEAYKAVFADAYSFENYNDFDTEKAEKLLADAGFDADIDEVVVAKSESGDELGYVVTVTSHEAYGGDLQLAMGVQLDGTTNGISFLSLSETAGLGMEADTDSFKAQFEGKNVDQFRYTKSGATVDEEIDALSGATITTNAVTNAVNAGLTYVQSIDSDTSSEESADTDGDTSSEESADTDGDTSSGESVDTESDTSSNGGDR
jgi:RnfABCDGE-type electron transport complex D subunit/RnfABCDGE-type electron transport complex G subunit